MAAVVRYRCCEHCDGADEHLVPVGGHTHPCQKRGCPGRMPVDPETEG